MRVYNRLMRAFLLLPCLCVWAMSLAAHGGDASPAAPVQLVFDLADGSRIIGTPGIDRLKIATNFTEVDVSLSQMRTIEFSGENHGAVLSLQNGDHLSGSLAATGIEVTTILGKISVPMNKVKRIRITHAGVNFPEGLVLHYTFNGAADGRVFDTSDSGDDATIHGATYITDGKLGGAIRFTGDQQAVIIKDTANLQAQDFTLAAWVKRGSLDKVSNSWEDGVIFSCGQGGYGIGLHNDGSVYLCKVGIDAVFSSFRIRDKVFHHVAVTKKGGEVVFYLDGGAFPAENFETNFEFGTGAAVGARPDTLVGSFIGVIDEVTVFNRPLSGGEVKSIYGFNK